MSARAPARRRRSADGPAYLGVVAGIALAAAVFLPWYRTNLGSEFTPDSVTGWEATGMARAVLALAVVAAAASAALALEAQRRLRVHRGLVAVLGWTVVVACSAAAVLVAVRLARPVEPAEFFSRQLGLYLAAAAALAGIAAGAVHLGAGRLIRRPPGG